MIFTVTYFKYNIIIKLMNNYYTIGKFAQFAFKHYNLKYKIQN